MQIEFVIAKSFNNDLENGGVIFKPSVKNMGFYYFACGKFVRTQ